MGKTYIIQFQRTEAINFGRDKNNVFAVLAAIDQINKNDGEIYKLVNNEKYRKETLDFRNKNGEIANWFNKVGIGISIAYFISAGTGIVFSALVLTGKIATGMAIAAAAAVIPWVALALAVVLAAAFVIKAIVNYRTNMNNKFNIEKMGKELNQAK